MGTAVSRSVLNWFRGYARDIFQEINQPSLIAITNSPINNDNQMQSAIDDLRTEELGLVASWTEDLEPFWQPALDRVTSETRSVSNGGLMPDAIAADYDAMITDPDLNVRRYLKTLLRLLERAVQIDLAAA